MRVARACGDGLAAVLVAALAALGTATEVGAIPAENTVPRDLFASGSTATSINLFFDAVDADDVYVQFPGSGMADPGQFLFCNLACPIGASFTIPMMGQTLGPGDSIVYTLEDMDQMPPTRISTGTANPTNLIAYLPFTTPEAIESFFMIMLDQAAKDALNALTPAEAAQTLIMGFDDPTMMPDLDYNDAILAAVGVFAAPEPAPLALLAIPLVALTWLSRRNTAA